MFALHQQDDSARRRRRRRRAGRGRGKNGLQNGAGCSGAVGCGYGHGRVGEKPSMSPSIA